MSGFGFCSGISFRGRVRVGDLKVEVVPLGFRGFGSLTPSLGRLDIYLPKIPGLEDEKLPDKNDFPRVIGVKPSNRIKKHKVKKV